MTCEQKGCTETDTIKCGVQYHDDRSQWAEDTFDYCYKHAQENGFCYGCGTFCAGIESFDFSSMPGLCDICRDEVESELGWEDEEFIRE